MNATRLLVILLLFTCCSSFLAGPVVKGVNAGHSIPGKTRDTVLIRFDYKQSAIYHTFTFDVLDSVITILKKNKEVTISIDGYAYKDEGSDTICYYLSLNRALFIQTYILGRGVDKAKIISVTGHGKTKSLYQGTDKDGFKINCRAEITLNYPALPEKIIISDRDGDGVADTDDKCPDEFGYQDKDGCPNRGFVVVPFEPQQSNLFTTSYKVLDSVINILSGDPSLTISIEGHAYKTEGISLVCERLSTERALIVKNYLLSRHVDVSRIDFVKALGNTRPLNAGNNPQEVLRNSRAQISFSTH